MCSSAKELYDGSAPNWMRTAPLLLSDFTARIPTIELCEPVAGLRVLDLGCGEGYCARELRRRGAGEVVGIDVSEKMIEMARAREQIGPLGIDYRTGTATNLHDLVEDSFDLIVAVFLFNYLNIEQTRKTMRQIFRILKPRGKLVFAVPHPSFPFLHRKLQSPFYFDSGSYGYFSGRDVKFRGEIWRRDDLALEVQCFHKTVTDYFEALRQGGFNRMPEVTELTVKSEHLEMDMAFFAPLLDIPLHMSVSLLK
ncbi:MAG: class I SAM-dependent methyltransferase [Blastocatellia bacterium]